jgi:hypothetical protein
MMDSRLETTAKAREIAHRLLALRSGEASGAPTAAPPPRRPAIDYPRLQDHVRWFERIVQLYRAAAQAVADQAVVDADPAATEPDRLVELMARAHRLLLEHPVAAKSAFGALVAQGRTYAATPEGAALRARLARSPKLRRGSLVWRSLTMGMLDPEDPRDLPATYLDNLLRAIDRGDLEQLLAKLQLRAVAP